MSNFFGYSVSRWIRTDWDEYAGRSHHDHRGMPFASIDEEFDNTEEIIGSIRLKTSTESSNLLSKLNAQIVLVFVWCRSSNETSNNNQDTLRSHMSFLVCHSRWTFDRAKLDEGHCLQRIDSELFKRQIRSDTHIHLQLCEQCFETCLYHGLRVQRGFTTDRLGRDFRSIENIFVRSLFNQSSPVARSSARVEEQIWTTISSMTVVTQCNEHWSSLLIFPSRRFSFECDLHS